MYKQTQTRMDCYKIYEIPQNNQFYHLNHLTILYKPKKNVELWLNLFHNKKNQFHYINNLTIPMQLPLFLYQQTKKSRDDLRDKND